jgi:hypothetical protein
MPTPTEIANLALSHLGVGKEIANLETEASQEAQACRRYFPTALEATLRDFPYPFANTFAPAQLVETEPNEEWGYSYRYPSGVVKLIRILSGIRNDTRQSRIPYKIGRDEVGRLIYTDRQDAILEYTALVTDTSKFTADAATALSFRLAAYIAPRLTGGDPFKMGERAIKYYFVELGIARANAVNEQQDEEKPPAEWTVAREGCTGMQSNTDKAAGFS